MVKMGLSYDSILLVENYVALVHNFMSILVLYGYHERFKDIYCG